MIIDAFSLNRAHHTSRECNRKNYKKDGYRRVSRRFFSPPFFFVNRIQPFCEKEKNRSSSFCFLRSYPSIKKAKRASKPSFLTRKLIFAPHSKSASLLFAKLFELINRNFCANIDFPPAAAHIPFAWFCVPRVGLAWFGAGNLPAYRA